MTTRSRAAELARAEADRVENEPDDDAGNLPAPEPDDDDAADDDAQAEDAGDDPQAEPPSAEAVAAGIEREFKRHDDALRAIFGAEYDTMTACPTCAFLGVVPSDSPIADPYTVVCPECKGFGGFLTESKVDGKLVRQCFKCLGNGYIDKPAEVPAYAAPPPNGAGAGMTTATIPPMPVYDPVNNRWTDQFGNPLVGAVS